MSFGYIRQRHYVDNAMRFMEMHEHDLNWCIHERYLLRCIAYLASMIIKIMRNDLEYNIVICLLGMAFGSFVEHIMHAL